MADVVTLPKLRHGRRRGISNCVVVKLPRKGAEVPVIDEQAEDEREVREQRERLVLSAKDKIAWYADYLLGIGETEALEKSMARVTEKIANIRKLQGDA